MKTKAQTNYWSSAVTLFAILIAASMSDSAIAGTVTHYRQLGWGADANWYVEDDCGYSSVSVNATNIATPSGVSQSQYVSLYVSSVNNCTGEFITIYGDTTDIQFSGSRSGATLTGTIPVRRCVNFYSCDNLIVAEVNLVWVATGVATHGSYTANLQSPTQVYISRSMGSSAPATASGSIIEGGTSPLITGNSQSGLVSKITSGEITIIHQ